jgi:N utilization substance protein A
MDIDINVLRSLEREKDISFDVVVRAIEDALLIAYHRTEGAAPKARVELDRATGHVTVWATEVPEEGREDAVPREYDDTRRTSAGSRPPPPSRSSCRSCATPRTS